MRYMSHTPAALSILPCLPWLLASTTNPRPPRRLRCSHYRTDVKVILATNKIETLDPALIRPGRIDRKIEFPAPDQKTRRHIFQVVDITSHHIIASHRIASHHIAPHVVPASAHPIISVFIPR